MDIMRFCVFSDKESGKIEVQFWNTACVTHMQFLRERNLFNKVICLGRIAFDQEKQDFILYNEEYFYKNLNLTGDVLKQIGRLRRRFYPFVLNRFKKQHGSLEMKMALLPVLVTEQRQVFGNKVRQHD